jgi:hypothetical protein
MNQIVRAKFRCEQKDGENVLFRACIEGEENKEWSRWTPAGTIQMTINNPTALAAFEVGKDYFLDFTPVT